MEQPLPIGLTTEEDIAFDFTPWLAGASIANYTLTPSANLTKLSDSKTGGKVVAWVKPGSGVKVGASMWMDCYVVTNDTPPRKDTRRYLLVASVRTVIPQ